MRGSVAHSLGIPHYVVDDEADQFERLVIDYFSSEYPGWPDAESMRDVQREDQVWQSMEQSSGIGL